MADSRDAGERPPRRFRWTERDDGAAVLSFDVVTDLGCQPKAALTPAQRAVAVLAVHGHSNAEIARQLKISPRTVANHMASILARTRARSRFELARWVSG